MRSLFLPVLLALSACGFDVPVPERTAPPMPLAAPDAVTAKVKAEIRRDELARLAELLVRDGKGYFRFDRVRDAKDGGRERQVFVEMLGLEAEQAAALATTAMTSLGYRETNRFGDKNGIRISFRVGSEPPVRLLVRSRTAHAKLEMPAATASVYVVQVMKS